MTTDTTTDTATDTTTDTTTVAQGKSRDTTVTAPFGSVAYLINGPGAEAVAAAIAAGWHPGG